MKNAVIIHGKPSKEEYDDPDLPSPSNYHWIPWLQRQLGLKGVLAQTPEMPRPWQPDYQSWKQEFERFELSPETILVGHSCGDGFMVRWLSEHKEVKPGVVALVAPWLDPDKRLKNDFFDFELDPQLAHRAKKFIIVASDNDAPDIKESINRLQEKVPGLIYKELHNMGHFTVMSMPGPEFPQLLKELVG